MVRASLLIALSLATPAMAFDELPTLARQPASTSATSPWAGWSFGSEMIVASRRGERARVGGAASIAYHRALDGPWIVGLSASAGNAHFLLDRRSGSANFVATQARLAYDMGRFRPYVALGMVAARPSGLGYGGPWDSVNGLFEGTGKTRVIGTATAGFDYAITNNLSFGMAVTGRFAP